MFEMASLIFFIKSALPSGKMILLFSPLFLVYTAIGAVLAGWLRTRRAMQVAYTRKIFHFYIFTMAGIVHLLGGFSAVVLFGIVVCVCVIYAVFRGAGFPFYEAMARPQDEPHRTFFILVPMVTTALGGIIVNFFFKEFAYIGYFVGGWGDAVGEPVGAKWGKHRYKVPSLMGVPATRSWEGSLSVFLAGTAIAFFGLQVGGIPIYQALYTALACGMAGAAVEAVSSHGIDNLTIQIAATATASLFL
jgi:phytol kinase